MALVTPMLEDGSVDFSSLRALVDWHIDSGTQAIVAVGTTGESPTLTVDEHLNVIRVCVEHARGRIPVIAGAGANSTTEAIELTSQAKAYGAAASLQVVPYYNKPTQEGLFKHFLAVVETVDLPAILYNVPGRTVVDMSNETVLRLANHPLVIGIKDATGNVERGLELCKRAPADFAIYSGDDATATALMLLGAHGNISVTANVVPALMAQLCRAAMSADVHTARRIHLRTWSLHRNLFCEANPIPVKWALSAMGRIGPTLRLPLTELSPHQHAVVSAALVEAGVSLGS